MAGIVSDDEPSMPMRLAFDMVEALEMSNLMALPIEPTEEMVDAGAAAGRVDWDTARRIYSAMIRAAD